MTARVFVAITVAVALLLAMWFVVFGDDGFELAERRPAPGGGGLEVRMEEGLAAVDPLWRFSVRRSSGTSTRDWPVGCMNGDDPNDGYAGMKWTDADTFVVEANDGRAFTVDVNPDTGEPDAQFSVGSC